MTLENLKKHHAHLKWLKAGEFVERDFDYTCDYNDNPNGKEKGVRVMYNMGEFVNKTGQKRKELIIFKATKALEEFEYKYDKDYQPIKKNQVKVELKEEVKVEEVKPKSKGKK